jgi:hypothetical protein
MSRTVALAELLSNPATVVRSVLSEHETVVFVDGEEPVAELRPIQKPKSGLTIGEIFASLPHLAPGDAEAFAKDLEDIRNEANQMPLRDPWQS